MLNMLRHITFRYFTLPYITLRYAMLRYAMLLCYVLCVVFKQFFPIIQILFQNALLTW